jgi:hypothetical protein
MARAFQLLREGNLKYAFMEAGTASELAVDERMREFTKGSQGLHKVTQDFFSLPKPLKLVVLTQSVTCALSRMSCRFLS